MAQEGQNEGIDIPGESGVNSLSPDFHREQQVERASQKGWQPLEQWVEAGKDAADWVDAGEFLGRQKLFDRLHDSKRQITKLERDIAQMSKHFQDMEEASYQRALKELREQQAVAADNQDMAAVVKVSDEIADLKAKQAEKAKQAQANPQGQITVEFQDWKQENTWFESDQEMTQEAIAIGVGYAAANQNKSQAEVLKHVSDRIKKIYPEKFQKKAVTQRSAPAVESAGGGGEVAAVKKVAGKLTTADLDERESATLKTFLRRRTFQDRAKKENISETQVYLNDLAKAKGL